MKTRAGDAGFFAVGVFAGEILEAGGFLSSSSFTGFPDGGYNYLVREGSTPGPFPAETEIFAGTLDWHEVHFNLGA